MKAEHKTPMDPLSLLSETFPIFAAVPGGVQKLRELILQLAVQGKLVPQDPNDEPASVLLEKIAAEKARLVKEGKIKKAKPLPPITAEEVPFEVPGGWEWVRLIDIGKTQTGTTPSKVQHKYFGGEYPFIKPADISDMGVRYDNETLSALGIENGRLILSGSTLMVCIGGSIGKVGWIDRDCSCNQQINTLTPFSALESRYVPYVLKSPFFQFMVVSSAPQTTLPILSKGKWEVLCFPLPPLPEQHRIVSKVDQLTALCDDLEAKYTAKQAARQRLSGAALDAVLSAQSQADFDLAWQRVADNFELLLDVPESVPKLRQAVLQLAVQGKLVPQDPDDEPASVLLEKIAAEKARLVKEGKIKKDKPLPPITAEEVPFEVPGGWEWVRLNELSILITKGSSPKWQGVNYVDEKEGILFITSENVGSFSLRMDNRKFVESKFNQIEPRSILKKSDILMNIVGASIGRTAIYDLDEIANINQAVCLIRLCEPNKFLVQKYLLQFFNSDFCIDLMLNNQVENARANLSMGNIAKFSVPLPPLPEQHRIVAKVDQLMTLCEELEAKLTTAQDRAGKLVGAVVAQFQSSNVRSRCQMGE